MLLGDYIKLLQQLPADLEVYANRGGVEPIEINERNLPAVTPLCAFITPALGSTRTEPITWAEDFFPEATATEEDYIQKTAVVL